MNKSYGICYQGSKNLISENIIARLPKCDTFVDLFGGGGAMTHCACLSSKYKYFVYNDLNKMIYELFKQGVNAPADFNFDNYPYINKEQYYKLRGIHPYYSYTYSFNGSGNSWGFSEKYGIIPRHIKERNFRLNCLRELKKYGITMLNLDYKEALNDIINITDYYTPPVYSMVIYCDIPYEDTKKYVIGKFNNEEFYNYIYEWGKVNKQYIVISSYNISDKRFVEYASMFKRVDYAKKRVAVDEKLFVPDYLIDKIRLNSIRQVSIFDILDNN